MENTEKIVHRRFVSGTTPLYELIFKLGFREINSEGIGLKKIRIFIKDEEGDDKYLRVSHYETVMVRVYNSKEVVEYRGLTIHDEMLKFFAQRNPTNTKVNDIH